MKNYYVIETIQDSLPKVIKNLGELSVDNAQNEFLVFVLDNMKNLGYEYFDKAQNGFDFKGKGFYSKNQEKAYIKWILGLEKFEYGNTNFKLLN